MGTFDPRSYALNRVYNAIWDVQGEGQSVHPELTTAQWDAAVLALGVLREEVSRQWQEAHLSHAIAEREKDDAMAQSHGAAYAREHNQTWCKECHSYRPVSYRGSYVYCARGHLLYQRSVRS